MRETAMTQAEKLLSSKTTLTYFTLIVLLVGFLSVPSGDKVKIAESFFGSVTQLSEAAILEAIEKHSDNITEMLLDLGLGGSPWQTEKGASYSIGTIDVSGTAYSYMLNGTTGKMDHYGIDAQSIIQHALNNLTSEMQLEQSQEDSPLTVFQ